MELEDFLPTYPDYEYDPLFSIYEDELTKVIQQKKEFRELSLEEDEPRPKEVGDLLRHQLFLQRFMSNHTPYNGLLLWHSVGTGKTGSAIAVAEGLKNTTFKKVLLLVRSNTFIQNFKNEIAYVMTKGDYLPPESPLRPLTEAERTRRTNRLISSYYEFNTFQVFAKQVQNTRSPEALVKYYSNCLIIIDEVHNLRDLAGSDSEMNTYETIHKFLHQIEDSKVLLLTATPIKDQAAEFANVMNLILPLDKQLPTGKEFMNRYFRKWDISLSDLKSEKQIQNEKELIERVKGRISYLQPIRSDVQIINEGKKFASSPFLHVDCKMTGTQAEKYEIAYRSDTGEGNKEDESSLYKKSIQAALCVSPRRDEFSINDVVSYLEKDKPTEEEKLSRLQNISSKYHYVITKLLENPTHNSFIYCRDVKGSGIEVLTRILNLFGFQPVGEPDKLTEGTSRYAVITGETLEGYAERVIKAFNHEKNKQGKFIRVLIGSAAIGEGRSFMSIRDIFIVTPHWNFTDMDQAIGRGIRYGSHRFLLPEERTVTIHRLRASISGKPETSIDRRMIEVAYAKDILAKQIEASARTAAIDCVFNQKRNLQKAKDDSRQCLYEECDYKCAVPVIEQELVDTYNLFYTEKEYQAIKNELQKKFSLRFEYRLEELLAETEINKYSQIVVLRSITGIIYRHEPFTNPLGFTNYIKYHDGILFLVHDFTLNDVSYSYDTKLGQFFPKGKFIEYSKEYSTLNLSEILERIVSDSTSEEDADMLFKSLSKEIQFELLKHAIYEININKSVHPLYIFITRQMSSFVVEEDDAIQIQAIQESLSLTEKAWKKLEMDIGWKRAFIQRLEEFKNKYSFSYYGILDPSTKVIKLSRLEDIALPANKGTKIGTGGFNLMALAPILSKLNVMTNENATAKSVATYTEEITRLLSRLDLILTPDQNIELKKSSIQNI